MVMRLLAPQFLLLWAFIGSALAVHFRGKVRLGFWRQVSDHSTIMAPYNVLMYMFSAVPNRPILQVGMVKNPGAARLTPLFEIVLHVTFYAFIVSWVTIVVTSLLGCLFIRWTAFSPGLYPSRGLRGALLIYRIKTFNSIQRLWTWTITGQYLRALAGMHFARFGASECDVMFNIVPEVAPPTPKFSSPMDVSRTCSIVAPSTSSCATSICRGIFSAVTIMRGGVREFSVQLRTRRLHTGQCIQFRRQMRSRFGEPIAVAGNPAVKFASASFWGGGLKPTDCRTSPSS